MQPHTARKPCPVCGDEPGEVQCEFVKLNQYTAERCWFCRVIQKADIDERGCWVWRAAKDRDGYGIVRTPYRSAARAHRVSFEVFNSEKLDIRQHVDHLCRNRACIRPDHLEAVACGENIRRGLTGYRGERLAIRRAIIEAVS